MQKLPLPPRPARGLREGAEVGSSSSLAEATRPPPSERVGPTRESSGQETGPRILPAALRAAVGLARRPSLARKYRREPLPAGILQLIRIAARSDAEERQARHLIDTESTVSRAVAIFYLEQVLWVESGDPFRALGLSPGARQDEVTENAACLMKWLHPYMEDPPRAAAFADRVLEAWEALTPKEEGAGAEQPVEVQAAVELPAETRQPKNGQGPASALDLPRAVRRRRKGQWTIGLVVVAATIAIAVAALGVRFVPQRGGATPATDLIVSGRSTER